MKNCCACNLTLRLLREREREREISDKEAIMAIYLLCKHHFWTLHNSTLDCSKECYKRECQPSSDQSTLRAEDLQAGPT